MTDQQDIEWRTEKRKISDLKDHPKNPRCIKKEDMEQLKKSIEKFNYVEMVVINSDNTILAGHMRTKALKALKKTKQEIEVRVPNRLLTDLEAEEYLIRSNKNVGDWDLDLLANQFDVSDLISYGFDEKFLLGDFEDYEEKDNDEDEKLDEKDFDETITDNLSLIVKFVISIPNEDSTSLNNQLDDLLKGFPRAKMEKKI